MGLKIGLVINPFAGLGGRVGLKGSDGKDIQQRALDLGAIPQAGLRVSQGLAELIQFKENLQWYTAEGDMGADCLESLGFDYDVVYKCSDESSSPEDTVNTVEALEKIGVDILIFAGGDGTARDVVRGINENQLCLGIPAGCKIYSGVFSVTPEAAARVVVQILSGELYEYATADVLDIDEEKYRKGIITTRFFGEMLIPRSAEFMQNVKQAGRESEDLVKEDVAAWVIETMEPTTLYLIGSGRICMAIKEQLGVDGSLLGVDAILDEQLILKDGSEADLMSLISNHQGKVQLVITPIGGQGMLLGRGNHTICHQVIDYLGIKNTQVVASKTKLKNLEGQPLGVDTGDVDLNHSLSGYISVITGYDERVLYQVSAI